MTRSHRVRPLTRSLASLLLGAIVGASFGGCSPTLATPSAQSADPSSPSAAPGRSPLAAEPTKAPPQAGSEPSHEHGHGAPPGPEHAGHQGHGKTEAAAPASSSQTAAVFACPMHPEVRGTGPSLCPKCNMKLERLP